MSATVGVGEELPVPPTLDPDREAAADFETAFAVNKDNETVEVIYIGEVEADRHLVVVPHQVWHRTGPKRKLGGLIKPISLEVASCSVSARDIVLEEPMMKVWMGLMTASAVRQLQPVEGKEMRDGLSYLFAADGDPGYLPHVHALAQLSQEQFNFVSAESAMEGAEVDGPLVPKPDGYGSADASLPLRVTQLETTLSSLQATLDVLVERMPGPPQRKVTFAPKPKVIQAPKSKDHSSTKPSSSRYPSLDPGVVAAAISAGVESQALEDMERMMSSNLTGAKRLREPALRTSKAAPRGSMTQAEELSESEEEDAQDEGGSPPASSGEVQSSLEKLTEILLVLTADKARKSKTSKVDQALDSITGGSHGDGTAVAGGLKRAASARRALRQALQDHPEDISALIEKLMLEDLTCAMQTPGVPPPTLSARAWIEHRSRIGPYRTAAYCSWAAGGILDDLIRGRPAHARAKAALLVLQLDQTAIDRGSWTLSAELSLEQGPPFSNLGSHVLPSIADGESPYSKLLDARWAEICLSHLRDAEDFISKRKALGKKQDDTDKENPQKGDKIRPKAKAKARSGTDGSVEA